MKKGTYQSRRRVRKIKRFMWVFRIKIKNLFIEIVGFLISMIFKVSDKLYRKRLKILKRGEIYEGIKK